MFKFLLMKPIQIILIFILVVADPTNFFYSQAPLRDNTLRSIATARSRNTTLEVASRFHKPSPAGDIEDKLRDLREQWNRNSSHRTRTRVLLTMAELFYDVGRKQEALQVAQAALDLANATEGENLPIATMIGASDLIGRIKGEICIIKSILSSA